MTDLLTRDVAPIGAGDVATFTNGECGTLAVCISERTGWSLVLISDGVPGSRGWVHAGVRVPDGRILDVEGLHVEADWSKRWVPFAREAAADDLMSEEFNPDAVRVRVPEGDDLDGVGVAFDRAEEVAAMLIAIATSARRVAPSAGN